jgi:hypothetical protein
VQDGAGLHVWWYYVPTEAQGNATVAGCPFFPSLVFWAAKGSVSTSQREPIRCELSTRRDNFSCHIGVYLRARKSDVAFHSPRQVGASIGTPTQCAGTICVLPASSTNNPRGGVGHPKMPHAPRVGLVRHQPDFMICRIGAACSVLMTFISLTPSHAWRGQPPSPGRPTSFNELLNLALRRRYASTKLLHSSNDRLGSCLTTQALRQRCRRSPALENALLHRGLQRHDVPAR